MTDLNKKVSRRVTLFLDNRLSVRNRDQITVTLHPDGTIGFRAYKCRREVRLPLIVAYKQAIKAEAQEELRQRQAERKALGLKPRKVRRTSLLTI
jgi:hypothetical protein